MIICNKNKGRKLKKINSEKNMDEQNFSKCCHINNKKLVVGLVLVLTVFLAALVVSTAVDIQNKIKQGRYINPGTTITVTDTGEIYAKPDLAIIDFSVVTEGKTVTETMNKNSEKMNKVIGFVKEQGVEAKDLKTTNFNIYPRYEWQRVEIEIYPYPPGKRVLVGYDVSQTLEVKIRNLDKVGKIIEGATGAGANEIGNLQFTIDKEDELKKQARAEAIEKAKSKAKELASQLGVKLVRITNFSESEIFPRFYDYALKEVGAPAAAGATPQIETGENKISVTVTITYEIN